MKLPKVYLRDLISERFTRRLLGGLKFLFEFIPHCPESRDFRFTPTSSGEFKFKYLKITD